MRSSAATWPSVVLVSNQAFVIFFGSVEPQILYESHMHKVCAFVCGARHSLIDQRVPGTGVSGSARACGVSESRANLRSRFVAIFLTSLEVATKCATVQARKVSRASAPRGLSLCKGVAWEHWKFFAPRRGGNTHPCPGRLERTASSPMRKQVPRTDKRAHCTGRPRVRKPGATS